MPAGWAAQRLLRDAVTLLYVTIPFLALAVTFLILGKLTGGGLDALDYLVYAMATGVLWAAAVILYMAWIVIRDGWQLSSVPAATVLAVVALAVAAWAYDRHAREAECRAAEEFYQTLVVLPAAERAAAIRDGEAFVRTPTICAIDSLRMVLGRHVLDPEPSSPEQDAARRAILAELLAAGLPPDYRLLYGFAVSDADPAATRMLLQRRRLAIRTGGAEWDLFPDDIVRTLLTRAREAPGTEPERNAARYRATLAVLVEEAGPDPTRLTGWTRETLMSLGLLPASATAR
jgi:hypothetical protein